MCKKLNLKTKRKMKGLYSILLIVMMFGLSGFYYPATAQDQRNSAGSYSQYMRGSSTQNRDGLQKAPPEEGDPIEFPVGPGFAILIGLSLCYMSYVVLTKSKKEEK